ncbi:MAG TPA: FtsQ-type POTRA domain-containing protein [Pyrinomonadaceae bacterium]|nr:FtsQ-type POTRA domain-containing protein [Pyrinomonadaceae bacterium]
MAKKKRATTKSRTAPAKRRITSSKLSRGGVSQNFGRFGLPLAISGVLIVAIAALGFTFYRSAADSQFFKVRNIEVRGTNRTPSEDIRRIVASETEKPGVWNADLADIRLKIEKFPFVKSASVSRMLPAGIRVDVVERVPQAIVHLKAGDFLVDGEGTILSAMNGGDKDFPFVLHGWDEAKTEKAPAENIARLKLYKKMLDEWKQFDLMARVKQVDLTDVREPMAVVEDSGRTISVLLAKDSLGKSLKTAIEVVTGKGAKIKSVNVGGASPVIQYLEF